MGAVFCCFPIENPVEDDANSSFNAQQSIRLSCFFYDLFTKYSSLFNNLVPPATNNGALSLNSNAGSDTTTTAPRPQPLRLDANLSCSNLTIPSANDATQLHKDTEQIRDRVGIIEDNVTDGDDGVNSSRSHVRPSKAEAEFFYSYASTSDEDVCSTCLEEYSFDNPRIVTECKHHYHLGCIYEWMERSQTCPVCSKVMIFDETR